MKVDAISSPLSLGTSKSSEYLCNLREIFKGGKNLERIIFKTLEISIQFLLQDLLEKGGRLERKKHPNGFIGFHVQGTEPIRQ